MANRDFVASIANAGGVISGNIEPAGADWAEGGVIYDSRILTWCNNTDAFSDTSAAKINVNTSQPSILRLTMTTKQAFPNYTTYSLAKIPFYDGSEELKGYFQFTLRRGGEDSFYFGIKVLKPDSTQWPSWAALIDGVYRSVDTFFERSCVYASGYFYGSLSMIAYQHYWILYWPSYNSVGGNQWSGSGYITVDLDKFSTLFGDYHISEEYSSEAYGDASGEGGYTGGSFDDSSDTIGIPSTPALGVTSAGFVNVYNPSAGALQNLGAELFPDLTFTPDAPISGTGGVTEAIEAMATALVNFGNQIPNIVNMYINSNLIQYVIDCHILPVAPSVGTSENIKIGFKTFTPSAARVTSDYVDFDCGTLSLSEFYANFIDYAPYTRAKLFLPFVGFVDIAPEYWQSGSLNVIYRFNIIDGSFMAFVKSTSSKSKLSDSVIAQYGGNACVHIPLTGLNYSSMVSGVVSAAAAVVSAQSGVQAATKAIGGAVDVMNSKPPVQQSNGYNATTSFLGVRTPYLLIERSVSNFSASYASEKGIPSNISTSFANLSGFTTASDIHLDGITGATEAELNEIARLLSEGVIL